MEEKKSETLEIELDEILSRLSNEKLEESSLNEIFGGRPSASPNSVYYRTGTYEQL
jgi:hypothetical protein